MERLRDIRSGITRTEAKPFDEVDIWKQYSEEVSQLPVATQNETAALSIARDMGVNLGFNPVSRIAERNLRLVTTPALHRPQHIELLDAIQDGNIGLIHAAQEYDASRDVNFSTYATKSIKRHIRRGGDNFGRVIPIAEHMEVRHRKIQRAVERLEQIFERKPTTAEIAGFLNIPEVYVKNDQRVIRQIDSLDAPSHEEAEILLGETVLDETANTEKQALQTIQREEVSNALLQLTNRERGMLIQWLFGGDEGKGLAAEHIAPLYGLSRERVRVIIHGALDKLRTQLQDDEYMHPLKEKQVQPLTPRQKEIFILIGKGYSYKEIAAELSISPETVKKMVSNVIQHKGVSNRDEVLSLAIQNGEITLDQIGKSEASV